MTKKGENVYLPNEVFIELTPHFNTIKPFSFAFAYYTYLNFLYKYCWYLKDDNTILTQAEIKSFLGYSPDNRSVDKIVKDGGLLEQIGYIKTITDYPVNPIYDEETGFVEGFEMASDIREMVHKKELVPFRGIRVKMPTTLLERSKVLPENEEDREYDGTLYDVRNTFNIGFDVFKDIIKNLNLGCNGFLIYSILKSLCGTKKKFRIPQDELAAIYKIRQNTIQEYLRLLEKENYIYVERKMENGKYLTNTYHILR
ncbi:hypothetical protein [Bacillus cereus]|uniref:hypothetical protein n=1 Tax=Bacillus cereus TaxID=1396 RepID=UPI000BF8476B|nr:hypothetical protein [Bacillus cereus]PFL36699.1 hypothetical protein COJ06_16495 [Bacillus cereus]PGQ67137.1 hypothetical protein COA27_25295 [Bacillus cereus]